MTENRLVVTESMAQNKVVMLSNLEDVKLNAEKHILCVKSELENQFKVQKVQWCHYSNVLSCGTCIVLGSIRVRFAKVFIRLNIVDIDQQLLYDLD